jgi:hypothetical protein
LRIDQNWAALLLLLSPLVLAGDNGDAVNERIPVTKIEMEAHWQLNCTEAWAQLRTATTDPAAAGNCGFSAELIREIRLCGFIYQAPGEQVRHRCPDYRSASSLLEQRSAATPCSQMLSAIGNLMDCSSTMN